MSYPEAVYHGPGGERTAWFRSGGSGPDLVYPNGTEVRYVATGAETDGRFGIYRWDAGIEPSGPAPHFHRTMSESFFVLSGTIKIYDGNEWIDTHPGDYVYVPPGGIHGFRNESGALASMLLMFAPGAPREAYFEGQLQLGDMSDGERAAFYLEHDNLWI